MHYQKEIFAQYTRSTIRIYQAYCPAIAEEAVKQQTFGENFSTERMTWLKPSFLWMMYRSNWGTRKNQECILAIDLHRQFFDRLLTDAVLTSPDSAFFRSGNDWETAFTDTDVYCQWDPDRNLNGSPMQRAAVQIGIRRTAVQTFLTEGIQHITDMTPSVRRWNVLRKHNQLTPKALPAEKLYTVTDKTVRKRLQMG